MNIITDRGDLLWPFVYYYCPKFIKQLSKAFAQIFLKGFLFFSDFFYLYIYYILFKRFLKTTYKIYFDYDTTGRYCRIFFFFLFRKLSEKFTQISIWYDKSNDTKFNIIVQGIIICVVIRKTKTLSFDCILAH